MRRLRWLFIRRIAVFQISLVHDVHVIGFIQRGFGLLLFHLVLILIFLTVFLILVLILLIAAFFGILVVFFLGSFLIFVWILRVRVIAKLVAIAEVVDYLPRKAGKGGLIVEYFANIAKRITRLPFQKSTPQFQHVISAAR